MSSNLIVVLLSLSQSSSAIGLKSLVCNLVYQLDAFMLYLCHNFDVVPPFANLHFFTCEPFRFL